MTTGVALAAQVQMVRDRMRREVLPFVQSCDHQVEALPVVDFRLDYQCRLCYGFRSFSSGLLANVNMTQFSGLPPAGQVAALDCLLEVEANR